MRLARSEPLQAGTRKATSVSSSTSIAAARRLVAESGVLTQSPEIQDLARGGRDQLEEARVASHVAHEGFRLDLFPQVAVDVSAKVALPRRRVGLRVNAGQRSMRQHAIQVERVGHLAGEERVKVVEVDSPRQEIGAPSPELARARPRQQEAKADRPLVEQHLHEIEEGRDPCTSLRKTVRTSGPAALSSASRRSGRATYSRKVAGLAKFTVRSGPSEWRSVDLPTWRGPRRRTLRRFAARRELSTRSNTWVK